MEEYKKPCIVLVARDPDEDVLRQLLAGTEEEGIPAEVMRARYSEVMSETHNASEASRLGIGIGVFGNRVILHFNKLREDKPVIDTRIGRFELYKARNIGSNAARLYKVMPLKGDVEVQNEG